MMEFLGDLTLIFDKICSSSSRPSPNNSIVAQVLCLELSHWLLSVYLAALLQFPSLSLVELERAIQTRFEARQQYLQAIDRKTETKRSFPWAGTKAHASTSKDRKSRPSLLYFTVSGPFRRVKGDCQCIAEWIATIRHRVGTPLREDRAKWAAGYADNLDAVERLCRLVSRWISTSSGDGDRRKFSLNKEEALALAAQKGEFVHHDDDDEDDDESDDDDDDDDSSAESDDDDMGHDRAPRATGKPANASNRTDASVDAAVGAAVVESFVHEVCESVRVHGSSAVSLGVCISLYQLLQHCVSAQSRCVATGRLHAHGSHTCPRAAQESGRPKEGWGRQVR
jgi:hypothetical protein